MSRCFPYPPPGYSVSRSSRDALIESIKFKTEKVKTKEQRKEEKKREKKEKRKEKKDKSKHKSDKSKHNPDKSNLVQTHSSEKLSADTKREFLSNKGYKADSEQLERSNLTVEHWKPVCLRAPSSSSESTENSNKRKRQPSPVDVTRGHGKIIRIRLSSKKLIPADASANEPQPCSTSGRTHFPPQKHEDNIISQGFGNRVEREQICSTSQPIEAFIEKKTTNPPVTNAVMTPMQREESLYNNLMASLAPPHRLDASLDADDDLDWLFKGKKKEQCSETKRISGIDNVSCSSRSGLWPRAQYLQEVDLYALPFTVPF